MILLHVSFSIYVVSIAQEQQLEAPSSSGCQSSAVMKVEGHWCHLIRSESDFVLVSVLKPKSLRASSYYKPFFLA